MRPGFWQAPLRFTQLILNLKNVIQRDTQLAKSGLPHTSAQFLIGALDVFHDEKYRPEGLPDSNNESTISELISHSYNIGAPAGTVGNWNACVFTTPNDALSTMYPVRGVTGVVQMVKAPATSTTFLGAAVQQIGYADADTTSNITMGATNVWCWNHENTEFFPYGSGAYVPPSTAFSDSVLQQATGYGDVAGVNSAIRYRVYASGFEITNTTAPLNKQGTITSVRVPAGVTTHHDIFSVRSPTNVPQISDTGNKYFAHLPLSTFRIFQAPPPTLPMALTAGAIQRPAAAGDYSLSTYDQLENHLEQSAMGCIAMDSMLFHRTAEPMYDQTEATAWANNSFSGNWDTPSQSVTLGKNFQQHHLSPRDINCVYLTGLSKETTLTVTARYVVELAPRTTDTDFAALVPLKRVPPPMDMRALQIYQRATAAMPSSVPVGMNPSGEWWAQIFSAISRALPAVGTAAAGFLGPEAAPLIPISNFAGMAAKAIADRLGSRQGVIVGSSARPKSKKKKKNASRSNSKRPRSSSARVVNRGVRNTSG